MKAESALAAAGHALSERGEHMRRRWSAVGGGGAPGGAAELQFALAASRWSQLQAGAAAAAEAVAGARRALPDAVARAEVALQQIEALLSRPARGEDSDGDDSDEDVDDAADDAWG